VIQESSHRTRLAIPRVLPAGAALAAVVTLVGCVSASDPSQSGRVPVPPSQSRPAELATPPAPPPPPPPVIPERLLAAGATLTLAEIVDIALQNNPATRASYFQARAAAAQLGSRKAPYYPSVALTASASRADLATQNQDGVPVTSYGPAVELDWLLLDLGGRSAEAEDARQALLAADWSHNATIQDVILAVQRTFVQYLNAKAQLDAARISVRQGQAALDAATTRHDAGVATIAEVLQARTALSQFQLDEATVAGQVLVLRGSLATAMGLPATTPYDVGTLPADVPLDTPTEAVERLIAVANARRPDLLAARAQVDRAAAHIDAVRSDGLPTLGLSASANRNYYEVGDVDFRNNWSARLLLSFPLFTGWASSFNIQKAKDELGVAQAQAAGLEQQVVLQVWTSHTALTTAAQLVRTSRDLLASAEQSERVALGRYREGVGTIIDLLAAQSALADARAQEIQARSTWFAALAQLARDTGAAAETLQAAAITIEKREP
jgi:outer membrane protein TolC